MGKEENDEEADEGKPSVEDDGQSQKREKWESAEAVGLQGYEEELDLAGTTPAVVPVL